MTKMLARSFAIAVLVVLSVSLAIHANVVIGDFEGALDPGWSNNSAGNTTVTFGATGATLNNQAVQLSSSASGFVQQFKYDLNTAGLATFLANPILSFDLTWDASTYDTTGSGSFSQVNIVHNSQNQGFTNLGRPDTDTLNVGFPGGWDHGNFPGVQTGSMTIDLQTRLGAAWTDIVNNGPGGWNELILVMNHNYPSGAMIYDNVRLVPEPTVAGLSLLGLGLVWARRRR